MSIAYSIMLAVETLLGLFMVVLILLHAPKGEGMGAIGSSATLFSTKRDAEAGLDRLTWMVATVFMLISLILGFGLIR